MSVIIEENPNHIVVEENGTTIIVEDPTTSETVQIASSTIIGTVETVRETIVTEVGTPGPQGEVGPQGAVGAAFQFFQEVPSATWTVVHNLGKYPTAISVWDTADTNVVGSVQYDSINQVTLLFSAAFAGRAELI